MLYPAFSYILCKYHSPATAMITVANPGVGVSLTDLWIILCHVRCLSLRHTKKTLNLLFLCMLCSLCKHTIIVWIKIKEQCISELKFHKLTLHVPCLQWDMRGSCNRCVLTSSGPLS